MLLNVFIPGISISNIIWDWYAIYVRISSQMSEGWVYDAIRSYVTD